MCEYGSETPVEKDTPDRDGGLKSGVDSTPLGRGSFCPLTAKVHDTAHKAAHERG